MAQVLIVSKTRMAESRVCVGGVDLDGRVSIRLLDETGFHESESFCPYEIGDLWDITYVRHPKRPAPHTEDTKVLQRHLIRRSYCQTVYDYKSQLQSHGFTIYQGSLDQCFSSKLIHDKQYYITHANVPDFSTCFWINDRPLRKNDFNEKKRISYLDGSTPWGTSIAFVGLGPTPDFVPTGSLIRLSLANWWQKPGDSEERCYLQVSGVY